MATNNDDKRPLELGGGKIDYKARLAKVGDRKVGEGQLVEGAKPINVNPETGNVEVRWMFTPDPAGPHEAMVQVSAPDHPTLKLGMRSVRGRHTYNVLVRSARMPHSKLVGELAPEDVTSLPKMRRNISVLAGALAEELNERYADNLDPSEIARAAGEAYREMVEEQRAALLHNTH